MLTVRSSFALAVIAASIAATATLSAAPPQYSLPHAAPIHSPLLSNNPLIGADGRADIIIILKDEPATRTYSKTFIAGGRGAVAATAANNAAKSAIATLAGSQNAFVSSLDASKVSYTEIFRLKRVLNGIAVRMKPEDMDKVRALPGVDRVEFLPKYDRPTNIHSVPFVNAPEVWSGANSGGLNLPFNATGKGVKIGDIDTGLDFIHPDFGGTGALADYQDVDPTSVIGKNSHNVIFPTAKVVGGVDLAGDAYDGNLEPEPDSNPMDCGGHGSHTAGTMGGVGVNNDGTPYTGMYNTTAPYSNNLKLGPGVAPQADMYAIRVFGCSGSTGLVTEAIEWATDPNGNNDFSDHLDVINMSLGSDFGLNVAAPFDPEIEAINNAALVGLISVASSGNSGDTFFISGTPGTANMGFSVAASVDDGQTVTKLHVSQPAPPADYSANPSAFSNPNGIPPPNPGGQAANIVLALDATGGLSQGCGSATTVPDPNAFSNAAAISGKFALIDRGTCNFFVKVLNAQAAGAVGVIVDNNAANSALLTMGNGGGVLLPAPISIPSLFISKEDGTTIKGELGGTVASTFNAIAQPQLADTIAGFTSRGPTSDINGVIGLKPDLAAPGLNIPSVQTGITCDGITVTGCLNSSTTGFIPGGQVLTISGTSMAAPHVTGLVALLRELNPDASVEQIKAMAINGARHDIFSNSTGTSPLFGASRIGAGRMDAAASAASQLLAYNADVAGAISVTFDLEPVGITQATHNVTLENPSASPQSVTLAIESILTAPGVSYSVPAGAISVPAHGSTTFVVTLDADTSQMSRYIDPTMATTQSSALFAAPGSTIAFPRQYIAERSAVIKVLDASNDEVARVPVYAALRPHSTMTTAPDLGSSAPLNGTTALTLSGSDVCSGTIAAGPTCSVSSSNAALKAGEESFVSPFELQFTGEKSDSLPGFANLHYVGVNSQDDQDGMHKDYFFGVATYGRWGSPSDAIYNVCVDSDGDGLFDKVVSDIDLGHLDQLFLGQPSNSPQDTFVSFVYDNEGNTTNFSFVPNFYAGNQADTGIFSNNTIILPASGVDLGIAAGVTKIHYGIAVCHGFDGLCGAGDWTFGGQGTNHCGGSNAIASFDGPFAYDAGAPGVDGTGQALLEDLNGATLAVAYDVNHLVANGSTGMLLLHSHNTAQTSAEVVVLDRVFANGFETN